MTKTNTPPSTNLKSFKKALPIFGVILLVVIVSIGSMFYMRYRAEQTEKQSFRDLTAHLEYIENNVKDDNLQAIHSDNKTKGFCSYSAFERGWGCRTSIGFKIENDSSAPDIYMSEIDKVVMSIGYFKKADESADKNNPGTSYSATDTIRCTLKYYSKYKTVLMECWAAAAKSWYPNSEPEYSTAPGKDAWRE